jgi:FkbM family methyltransferase
MKFLKQVRLFCRKMGRDLLPYDPVHHPLARRAKLFQTYGIDLVFDIGANTGQFAQELRETGYAGRIVSFEPLSTAFRDLQRWARADGDWMAVNAAVGQRDGTIELNIAENSTSSSILEMLPSHLRAEPQSAFKDKERVRIIKLDSVFDDYCSASNRAYLKIDVQGFEEQVLEGARCTLPKFHALQVEMSLIPLYAGQPLFADLLEYLTERGFAMVGLEPVFIDPASAEVLQVDGIFRRVATQGRIY